MGTIILCGHDDDKPVSRQERWRQRNKEAVARYMRRYRKKLKMKRAKLRKKRKMKRA